MKNNELVSFELFAGAGGLALGAQLAGFHSAGTVEWNKWAWSEAMRQLGNAVPVLLAQKVMASVAEAIITNENIKRGEHRTRIWAY